MAKNNKLVTRTKFSNSLRNDLNHSLLALSKETDIPMSKLLDQAIELLLKKHNFSNTKE
ncbi:ribbon-helix-helix domain-containing protein [Psychrobacillus sp. MER TA 171]|uniref:ribbon-helix-helix domain-containing protein n=1 Tax=Psychrobacillus sp. MER TA 171 TaxID=2939577 RepID=UPI0020415E18|nr:ribbon-helix-helix domain-containing protein [Psychrobacillus sp. MER TA 171]MCM3358143.1 ribbon-helix-helix domain-containing protein [Psychrobacillus sp. MER TA 171]